MIKKIYPSREDCKVKNIVVCNEMACGKVFKGESNLNLHLAKSHGKTELLQSSGIKHYHCPEAQCIYHEEKHMKNMKFLRQHYLKVHMKREYNCSHCQNNFSTQKSLENHFVYCGVKFSCCECEASYSSYETLQTHGRRKNHKILKKQDYTLKVVSVEVVRVNEQGRFILPKPENIISGTEEIAYKIIGNNKVQLMEISPKPQTILQPLQSSVETQTDESSYVKVGMTNVKNQRTIDTQTDISDYVKMPIEITHRPTINEMSNPITNSSSTQTCTELNLYVPADKNKSSVSNNAATIIGESMLSNNINNFEFDNCNMETQTDFIFDDVMFGNDYLMSNMYTQTCDDYLNQFNFNDIQTQTVFDDVMLKSVESQTFMPARLQNICKDMSHTETQTDAEFRQMLEVINS